MTVLCDKKSIGRVSKSNTKVFRANTNSKLRADNFRENYEKKAHCEVLTKQSPQTTSRHVETFTRNHKHNADKLTFTKVLVIEACVDYHVVCMVLL